MRKRKRVSPVAAADPPTGVGVPSANPEDHGRAPSADPRARSYRAAVVEAGPGEYTATISRIEGGAVGAKDLGPEVMDVVGDLLVVIAREDR